MDILQDEEEFNQTVCLCVRTIEHYYQTYIHKTPCMDSSQTGYKWLMEILRGNERHCHRMFRMDKEVFMRLCSDLQNKYGLRGLRRMCPGEMLGMFLFILGQGEGNRSAQERFQHSGETVSRYFSQLLDIVCLMAVDVIKPLDPEFNGVSAEILRDSRYMPHFKDCIGDIDGVHVQATIPPGDQVPYIGRKGTPTQNVMAAFNFDMQFIFACVGWEGTAHDTRIFLSVLRNGALNFPKPPNGKYYLVDVGYPQMSGYLGPYKGERYHLPNFRRGIEPTGSREVFNHRHSSLRSVIERIFGVWKKRWNILRDMPSYPFKKQVKIIIATMMLHNYIRRHARHDNHFDNMKDDLDDDSNSDEEQEEYHIIKGPGAQEIETFRNNIAASLMRS